jgi:hypothetical protein
VQRKADPFGLRAVAESRVVKFDAAHGSSVYSFRFTVFGLQFSVYSFRFTVFGLQCVSSGRRGFRDCELKTDNCKLIKTKNPQTIRPQG